MKKSIATGIGVMAVALAFAAKDPVIMTINGVDVPKSEFEYLYNKNNQQQINPQSLEEYVDMFQLYKMKVADAKAEGLDTLVSFRKEMEQYRHDLAAPYLADSTYLHQLVQEAYDRSQKEVEAKHIMLFKTRDLNKNKELRARIDSIKGVLDKGGNFEELAGQFSQDRASAQKGGNMGFITAGNFPYSFEVMAFSLPEGQISEVVESPVGYHILKGGKSRPARGRVKAAHILKLSKGDEAHKALAKHEIDSIYQLVKANPDKFAEIAKKNSDDRGSAAKGGELPWFGAGEMVAEFDSVAFAIPVGAISEPFETTFGYHIISKIDKRGVPELNQMKNGVLSKISNPQDERYKMVRKHQTARFALKHKAKFNEKTVAAMRAQVAKAGLDSLFFQNWTSGPMSGMPLVTVDGKNIPAKEFASSINKIRQADPAMAAAALDENLDSYLSGLLINAEEERLAKEEPDYRNLLKEYTEGSLLYEVSVRKVWDRAAKDTEGLNRYFKAHKEDYKWSEPHVKGIFVQTVNDSVADLIRARAAELDPSVVVDSLRKEFKGKIALERILIAKGGNPMVDHVAFGGPKVESSIANYQTYFMINPRILNAPEEVQDVKGLVTSDYQTEFQNAWEAELRKKYPVSVNRKVLKTVSRK